ncbi:hypothetical protein Tco_0459512 [Tanacetum coccineum]
MPPKKTTSPMTDEAIRALIAQGVADALAGYKANRSRNGDENHDSGSDRRRRMHISRLESRAILLPGMNRLPG